MKVYVSPQAVAAIQAALERAGIDEDESDYGERWRVQIEAEYGIERTGETHMTEYAERTISDTNGGEVFL